MRERLDPSIATVSKALNRCYGRPKWTKPIPLMDVLVETVLSQNTSDVNSRRAFRSLKRKYPRWDQVARADVRTIAGVIRSGGLANIKAQVIKRLIAFTASRRAGADLEFLKKMTREKAYQYLLGIKGVGPKTAACTLLFGAGMPVFPVDTHIYRISQRLGWAAQNEDRGHFQERFGNLIPDRMVYPMHLNMIEHGRVICHPRKPECNKCCLNKECKWEERTYA